MKGGTGVFIDNRHLEQNFMDFLQNSTIMYVGKGSYGVTYRAQIDPNSGYVSNYKNIDYNGYGTPVTSLLIKISALKYKNNFDKMTRPIEETDFKKEVNAQTETFLKTMNYLQPLCPAIVYSNTFDETNKNILDLIVNKISSSVPDINEYISNFTQNVEMYSVIGMELLSNYMTLTRFTNRPEFKLYNDMLVYLLVEFAIKVGYVHSDFHTSNIMINPDDTNYFKGYKGSIILIDFGFSQKIQLDLLDEIKRLHSDKTISDRYIKIIKILCDIPRPGGLDLKQHSCYDVVCKYQPVDSEIDSLFDAKQQATDEIVQSFDSKTDRNNFPLLPLSNAIKRKMFPGLLDEKSISIKVVKTYKMNSKAYIFNYLVDNIITLIVEQLMPKIKTLQNLSNRDAAMFYIKSSYYTCYLINGVPNLTETIGLIAAISGLYCSGINDKYSYKISNKKDIYDIYHMFVSKISTITYDNIKKACQHYKNVFSNVHVLNITDFMNDDDFTTFINYTPLQISNLLKNSAIYDDPKLYVEKTFRSKGTGTGPTESKSYEFPNKEEEDVFGGRCRRRKTKYSKRNKIRNKTRNKTRNKIRNKIINKTRNRNKRI